MIDGKPRLFGGLSEELEGLAVVLGHAHAHEMHVAQPVHRPCTQILMKHILQLAIAQASSIVLLPLQCQDRQR